MAQNLKVFNSFRKSYIVVIRQIGNSSKENIDDKEIIDLKSSRYRILN